MGIQALPTIELWRDFLALLGWGWPLAWPSLLSVTLQRCVLDSERAGNLSSVSSWGRSRAAIWSPLALWDTLGIAAPPGDTEGRWHCHSLFCHCREGPVPAKGWDFSICRRVWDAVCGAKYKLLQPGEQSNV